MESQNTWGDRKVCIIRAVAGQRSSPDLCFATKLIKIYDLDLKVAQVGCDGTA